MARQLELMASHSLCRVEDFAELGCALINGEVRGDTMFLIGSLRNSGTHQGIALIKADTNGNIYNIYSYFDPNGSDAGFGFNYDVKLLPDNSIVFLGGLFSENAYFLIKFSRQGVITLFKKIRKNLASLKIYSFSIKSINQVLKYVH